MAERKDVWITWTFAPVPEVVQASFERPTAFIAIPTPPGQGYREQVAGFGWPYPIRTIIERYAPGVIPNRIALLGFSEACQGPREILKSKDSGLVDTVVAIDGIHAQYDAKHQPQRAYLAAWMAYASLAAGTADPVAEGIIPGQRHLVITHSSIRPPFVSTTETAEAILYAVFGGVWPAACPFPDFGAGFSETPPYVVNAGKIPSGTSYPKTVYDHPALAYSVCQGGLAVLGYDNLDPTGIGDHRYQSARLLPRVVDQLVAPRWNDEPPVISSPVSSAPELNPRGVTIPESVWAQRSDQSIPWQEYLTGAGGAGGGGGSGGTGGFEQVKLDDEPLDSGGVSTAGALLSLALGGAFGWGVTHAVRSALLRR